MASGHSDYSWPPWLNHSNSAQAHTSGGSTNGAMTISIKTLSIMTPSIVIIYDTQHNDTQHSYKTTTLSIMIPLAECRVFIVTLSVVMLSVGFLLLRWVSLCWVSWQSINLSHKQVRLTTSVVFFSLKKTA
jgi:hypothetical protein